MKLKMKKHCMKMKKHWMKFNGGRYHGEKYHHRGMFGKALLLASNPDVPHHDFHHRGHGFHKHKMMKHLFKRRFEEHGFHGCHGKHVFKKYGHNKHGHHKRGFFLRSDSESHSDNNADPNQETTECQRENEASAPTHKCGFKKHKRGIFWGFASENYSDSDVDSNQEKAECQRENEESTSTRKCGFKKHGHHKHCHYKRGFFVLKFDSESDSDDSIEIIQEAASVQRENEASAPSQDIEPSAPLEELGVSSASVEDLGESSAPMKELGESSTSKD